MTGERTAIDGLTDRELAVLALMARGRSNHAIQRELFLSGRTVETHVRNIFTRLGLHPGPDSHRRVLAVLRYLGRDDAAADRAGITDLAS